MGVGPGSLALMEMMRAEDDRSRYREIVMPGHFVTQGTNLSNCYWSQVSFFDRNSIACYQDHTVVGLTGSSAAVVAHV